MTLIQAWKDSLNLCKPASLKLMFLVTLNAMKEVLRVLCVPWFLIPVCILTVGGYIFNSVGLASLVYTLTSVFMLLAARPSIRIKDSVYFKEYVFVYAKFLLGASLWVLAFFVCVISILVGWQSLLALVGYPQYMFFIPDAGLVNEKLVWAPIVPVLIILAGLGLLGITEYVTLFYLDRVGSVWCSFKKALLFIKYNLPMLLIYLGIALGIKLVYWLLIGFIANITFGLPCSIGLSLHAACAGVRFSLLGLLPYLFSVCLFVNLYTKRVHDQYSLYQ